MPDAGHLYPLTEIESAKEFYRQNGFAVVTGVFGPRELSAAKEIWDEISRKRAAEGKLPYRTILLPHESFPQILGLIKNPALVKAVRSFLGADIQLIQSQLMHGFPGTTGFSPHQDNYYNRISPCDAGCAAWIALEDAEPINGTLKVWPGSHREGLMAVQKDWFYLLKKTLEVAKALIRLNLPALKLENDSGAMERFVYVKMRRNFKPAPVRVPAGSVLFMHGDLVHASFPNKTKNRFRRSLLTNFIRKGAQFDPGILTGRKPVDF